MEVKLTSALSIGSNSNFIFFSFTRDSNKEDVGPTNVMFLPKLARVLHKLKPFPPGLNSISVSK